MDMGHTAVEGEDSEMGLSVVGKYLCAVGAKDARFVELNDPDAPAARAKDLVFAGEGAARWKKMTRFLRSWGFDGPFSVHGEHTSHQLVIATLGGFDMAAAGQFLLAID